MQSNVYAGCAARAFEVEMVRAARPFWDHWHTGAAFSGTALGLGALLLALIALGFDALTPDLGRALFYVLVIPTTMPGAFFWRNKGFVEHAREVGLADMPQLGVVPGRHC